MQNSFLRCRTAGRADYQLLQIENSVPVTKLCFPAGLGEAVGAVSVCRDLRAVRRDIRK